MKRFYDAVEVEEKDGGFTVVLDGRNVRTPQRMAIRLPTAALAEAVAGEWQAQGDEVAPHTMPITRLANSAIDLVAARRQQVIDEIAGFAASDLLCYRADTPPELVARQAGAWQPLLDWAESRYGARLAVTTGISPVDQPDSALRSVAAAVAAFDDFALAALYSATSASGSVVIGLALAEGEIDVDAAWTCTDLDDAWQAERWGEDDEAGRHRAATRADMVAAGRFFELCRPSS